MNTLHTALVIVLLLSALTIIGLVLLQHGKGADMGAAFGSGASGSLFGATGSSNFLSKSTGLAAAIFFGVTLALAYLGNNHSSGGGVMEKLPVAAPKAASVPAAPAASAPAANAPAIAAPAASAPAAAGNAASQANQIPK